MKEILISRTAKANGFRHTKKKRERFQNMCARTGGNQNMIPKKNAIKHGWPHETTLRQSETISLINRILKRKETFSGHLKWNLLRQVE